MITDFDANPADGGQDLIDLSAYDFTAASIGTDINIAAVGGCTSITTGADTVVLTGVNRATVDESDFIF